MYYCGLFEFRKSINHKNNTWSPNKEDLYSPKPKYRSINIMLALMRSEAFWSATKRKNNSVSAKEVALFKNLFRRGLQLASCW